MDSLIETYLLPDTTPNNPHLLTEECKSSNDNQLSDLSQGSSKMSQKSCRQGVYIRDRDLETKSCGRPSSCIDNSWFGLTKANSKTRK